MEKLYEIRWGQWIYDSGWDEEWFQRCKPFKIKANSLEEALEKGKRIAYNKISKNYIEGKSPSGPFGIEIQEVLRVQDSVLYKTLEPPLLNNG